MELWTIITDAELNLLWASGNGLGAILLTIVALAAIFWSRRGFGLARLVSALVALKDSEKPNKR